MVPCTHTVSRLHGRILYKAVSGQLMKTVTFVRFTKVAYHGTIGTCYVDVTDCQCTCQLLQRHERTEV